MNHPLMPQVKPQLKEVKFNCDVGTGDGIDLANRICTRMNAGQYSGGGFSAAQKVAIQVKLSQFWSEYQNAGVTMQSDAQDYIDTRFKDFADGLD